MPDYWPRVVDAELDAELAALGAVTIDGPKACGKTRCCRHSMNLSNAVAVVAYEPWRMLGFQGGF